jgi:hypothetical protein
MEQKAAQSHVRYIEAGSSPSSWVFRAVDRDLREDLLAARTAFEEQCLPESSLFRSADQHCTRITPSHGTELSRDLANRRFFESPSAEAPANLNIPTLFCESEYVAASEAGQSNTAASVSEPLISGMVATKTLCFAQPLSEVEKGRKARLSFAQRLEEAMVEQDANLTSKFVTEMAQQRLEFEAAEQERYDSTASLHDIELCNLRDDHEAETKGLERTMKDLRTRLADRGKAVRKLRREMRLLSNQTRDSENQLQEKCGQFDQLLQAFQERETMLQQQTEDFHDLREELDRTKRGCERSMRDRQYENGKLHHSHAELKERYDGLLTGLNQSNLDRQKGEAQLNTTRARLEATQAALGERERANEMLRARHDHMVAEKVKDYSWHVAHRVNPLAMKPMNTEDEIAEATKQLHETLEQQIELSADLRQKLESAQASNKAKFKKLKRVIANQSQEKVILEMALTMAQVQRDDWAKQYDEIAEAVASKLNFSSHARGVAERHILLQRTRHTLECELLEARLRGDRAVLECAIRQRHETIKLEKRDAEIAELKRKLGIMNQKFEYENGMALLYREVIDKEVPGLRARNSEVERLLEDQITNNVNAHHQAVFKDLHSRIRELETVNQYWENEIYTYLQDNGSLKTEYNIFSCCVFSDLSNAHGWRDDRDRLELENVAFRERFADELMNEPLVIPEDKKASKQIEEDFKLESIDELLLRQFAFSWEAVPRQIMAKDAPPWEHIRADMKEDMDARKKRWIAERDAVHDSFKKDCAEVPNDHEWIDDADEFEAMWKGNAKLVGEGIGFDGRMTGAGS